MLLLSTIVKNYFRWSPPFTAEDADVSLQELYDATVGSDLQKRFPVDSQYCLRYAGGLLLGNND